MISDWVPMELPLGLGMDTSSNQASLPPGTLRDLENMSFTQNKKLVKRFGFDTLLDTLPGAAKLFRYQGHLLAQQGGSLWDFSTNSNGVGTGKFSQRGNLRSVPARSRVAASESTDVPQCASASAAQFTCLAWLTGTGNLTVIKYQVIDESTGAVVKTGSIGTSGAAPADFSMAGATISGRATFVFAWGNYCAALYGAGDSNWYVSTNLALGNAGAVHAKVIFRPSVGEVYIFSSAAGKLYTALVQVNAGSPPTFTLLSSSAQAVSPDLANPTIALAYTTSPLYLAELYYLSSGGSGAGLYCSLLDPASCAVSTSFLVANANLPAHVALVASPTGATRLTALYDDGTVDCRLSAVYGVDITTGGFTGQGLNGVLFRGAQLASGAVYANNYNSTVTDCYFAIEYVSVVTPSLGNALGSGSTLADGTVMTASQATSLKLPSLNAVHMIVTLAGAVVTRTLRARALLQTQTPPMTVAQSGSLVVAARAVSQADTVTLASALNLGAAALVYADLPSEAPQTAESNKQLFVSGGTVTGYAGTVPVEHGFPIYPEIISSVQPTFGGDTTAVADNTSYAVGARVSPQYNVTTGSETDETKAECLGSVFVCVKAGKTGTNTASSMHADIAVGGTVTSGTAVFMRAGFLQTKPYSVGAIAILGCIYTPSVSNGKAYVLTGWAGGGSAPSLSTEPTWTLNKGDTIVGSATPGPVALYFTCIGNYPDAPVAGKSYTFAACYAWVDEQGNLHRSALSPMAAQTPGALLTIAPLLVLTTARCTQKTGARVEIYATDGDGTLLQLEAAVPNDPTLDAVAWSQQVSDATQAIGAVCYQGPLGAGGLPNTPPPPCSTLAVWGQRVATNDGENPYRVSLSQLGVDGYGVAWSDVTSVLVNNQYGAVGALAVMDSSLVIFQETAISIMQGDGPDNTGAGNAFSEPQVIAADVGCSDPNSVVLTPRGLLFRSQKGIYLLDRGTGTQFVGEPVQLVNALQSTLANALIDPNARQALLLTSSGTLYNFDYGRDAWGAWSSVALTSACVWQKTIVACDGSGRVYQQSLGSYNDPNGLGGFAGVQASFRIASVGFSGVQGYGRARGCKLLFSSNGGNQIAVAVRHDYSDTDTQTAAAQTLVAGIDEFEVRFSKQRSSAVGLRVSESAGFNGPLELLGVTFDVGILAGTARVSPTTKRTK